MEVKGEGKGKEWRGGGRGEREGRRREGRRRREGGLATASSSVS